MESVLAPLTGQQRDIMEAILCKVDTNNLEEGYKTFIGRVLREAAHTDTITEANNSEKEDKVLAEKKEGQRKKVLEEGKKLTGDADEMITESSESDKAAAAQRVAHIKKLAGIN